MNLARQISIIFFLIFLLSSCQTEKQKTWILLVDYTVYDRKDIKIELDKFVSRLKDKMEEYSRFKGIKETKILYMAVDNKGANKITPCAVIPDVQGRDNKNIDEALKSIKRCINTIKSEIKKHPSKHYQKTLYVEAIHRALEEGEKMQGKGTLTITVFGDLAIVDDECFLEEKLGKEKSCKCTSYNKLVNLKNKINIFKKKYSLAIEKYRINIPQEEGCRNERDKIWEVLLGNPSTKKVSISRDGF